MSTEPVSPRAAACCLGVICVLGLTLRVWGLGWGLPDLHHPDEIWILNRALALANNHFNPRNFLYPTLYFYALFAWEGVYFVVGRLAGWYGSLAGFERSFFVDPSRLVMAGRALTVLFGVLTLPALYKFGARLFDRATGLGAALLLAVAPFAVRDAHYIKHDVPVTLFVVLAQAAVARLVVDAGAAARRRAWTIAGAMAGLALSTQYYAFPVIVPIVVAAGIDARRTGAWGAACVRLSWAGAASIAAFLAASPFFVREFGAVVRDMVAVRQIDMDRAVAHAGAFSSLDAYVHMIATDALGWTTALLAVAGFALAFTGDRARGLILVCFPLAFLAFLGNTVPMSRYLNPMLPSLALAAAVALTKGRAFFHENRKKRPGLIFAALLIAVAVPGLVGSLRADAFYRQADTRTLAREFIERTAAPGTTVLVQPHGVQLRPSREALLEALRLHLGSESAASIKFQKQLEAAALVAPTYRVLYLGRVTDGGFDPDKIYVPPDALAGAGGLQPLRDLRVAYVALNRYNDGTSAFGPLDAALRREARLLVMFSPYRAEVGPDRRAAIAPFFHNTADRIDPALERPGPIVEVWQIE
jgi:hypothetical protein